LASTPHKWWLAGLLSLITPGLGQIYNGQIYKAIVFFFGPSLLTPVVIYVLLNSLTKTVLILIALIILLYRVAIVIEAIIVATRISDSYTGHRFNKWYFYIVLLVFALGSNSLISNYIKSSYIQAFKLPSESMQPTLLAGEPCFG